MGRKFKAGDVVRLSRAMTRELDVNERGTATIKSGIPDIPGGLWLDKSLGGFSAWNEKDLELVKKAPRT